MSILAASGAASWPIIGQMAWLFGYIMQGIYIVLSHMNIYSVGACIIIFTIITRMALYPLQVKQWKTTRLQAVIQPEMMEIQKKYAGRRDQASMMQMQKEQRELNEKYGTSTFSGCLTSVIQLPILFALYPVVYNIANYVPQIAKIQAEDPAFYERMNIFLGINLMDRPGLAAPLSILIPILAGLFQFLYTKMMMRYQPQMSGSAGGSMKLMNYMMPLVSVIFCFTFGAFIGLYWATQSAVMCVQQLIINYTMRNVTVEDLIAANREKQNKKRAKQGLPPISDKATMNTRSSGSSTPAVRSNTGSSKPGPISAAASMNTKNRNVEDSTAYYERKSSGGSIASRANMVRAFDEKNAAAKKSGQKNSGTQKNSGSKNHGSKNNAKKK